MYMYKVAIKSCGQLNMGHLQHSFELIVVAQLTVQVPPLAQGLSAQSSMSTSHLSPMYPVIQTQLKPPIVFCTREL